MPVVISKDLPATDILTKENIFVMHEERARTQDIRPLNIAIVNFLSPSILVFKALSKSVSKTSSLVLEISSMLSSSKFGFRLFSLEYEMKAKTGKTIKTKKFKKVPNLSLSTSFIYKKLRTPPKINTKPAKVCDKIEIVSLSFKLKIFAKNL